MRRILFLFLLVPGLAAAQSSDLATALRSNDFATAASLAGSLPDPTAAKLVTYFRLSHKQAATAPEIAAFIAANPDWPDQALLLRRRDEALAAISEDQDVGSLCLATPAVPAPRSGPALARCAAAAAAAGHRDDAAAYASAAWVAGFSDPDASAAFLARFGALLTPSDEAVKFRTLLDTRPGLAAAELARLAPGARALAAARLAVRAGAPDAEARVAALPASQRADPALTLDRLGALERADADEDALALWRRRGFAAEPRGGATLAPRFWALRARLAQDLLAANRAGDALLLADDTLQTEGEAAADARFLSGFIALRFLHQPARAARAFAALATSRAVISQARAHYWLGAAAAAAGDAAGARREWAIAATFPTTFYGQLAYLAGGGDAAGLNARIDALTDPGWTNQQALDFAGRELTRAAALLVAWGLPERARPFLATVSRLASDPATRSLDAHFALGLGLPDQAVAAARLAGAHGVVLGQAGWPDPFALPPNDSQPDLARGIMRQESSFDPGAVSPSGALGLMQLMPPTARIVARTLALPMDRAALTADPGFNIQLGTAYLAELDQRFAGALPLVIAAYNAGPNRVDQWLGSLGDPRHRGTAAMIDWIEQIPFAETRNYVERVIENITVYRARARTALPYPLGA